MRRASFHPLRTLLAWDRSPWASLALRVGVLLLFLRPWAFRFHPVDMAAELDASVLQAAQALGFDPRNPAHWPTAARAVLGMVGAALAFALIWWAVGRLRRELATRVGPGLLAVLVPLGAFVPTVLGLESLLRYLMVPMGFARGPLAVWGGWLVHPLVDPSILAGWLSLLAALAFLLVEPALLVLEGRMLLAEAREGALRARLSPHFLFNTLNTLEAQIEDDPKGALDTTQRLSSLFEQVLRVTDRPTVPLREELALVEDMLALERRRLGDRLGVRIEVPEELLDREIPVLGLQTLVENAIRHAIAPRVEGGTVTLRAEAEGAGLRITVEDSGDGTAQGKPGTGRALANLRARLRRPTDLVLERFDQGFRARFRWV